MLTSSTAFDVTKGEDAPEIGDTTIQFAREMVGKLMPYLCRSMATVCPC